MKNLLRTEELAMFGLSIYWFNTTEYTWWWYAALILVPDIGMLAYLVNTRIGAVVYNIFHHKGIALILLIAGWYFDAPMMELCGIILFGHASMDRIFGYGLKYSDHFKHTHLGWLLERGANEHH